MKIKLKEDGGLLEEDQTALKQYFEKVIELAHNNKEDEFVVDIDDVWALGYSRKDPCLRALHKDFIEGIDYIVETVETAEKGRPVQRILMNLRCMEFLVARRVRPVFEIYRRVFHAAVEQVKKDDLTDKIRKEMLKLISFTDYSTPPEERTGENLWFCAKDYTAAQYFYYFRWAVDLEIGHSGKTQEQIEKEWLLSMFPVAANLLYQLQRYTRLSSEDRLLNEALEQLGRWRSWIENHNIESRALLETPYPFDTTPINCIKGLLSHTTFERCVPIHKIPGSI